MDNETNNVTANEPLKFAHDILWVGLYLIIAALLGIITLIVLTKSYNSEVYGIWAQITVTLNLITPLLTLQLSIALVRFLAGEEDKEKRRRYVGSMFFVILLFCIFVFILASFIAPSLSNALFADTSYILYTRLTAAWAVVDSLFLFFISYLRARSQIRRISLIQIGFLLTKMAILLIIPKLGFQLGWMIGVIIALEGLVTLGILFIIVKDIGFPLPNLDGLSKFLAFSAPQIPGGVMLWIIQASDRYFITHFLNLSANGIYSSSALLATTLMLCYTPISYVLLPTISQAWEQKRLADVKIYFEYSIKLFLTIAIPAAIGAALLSQPILNILATSEFLAGGELVLLLSIGVILLGISEINMYIIYLIKQTKWLPLVFLGASIASITINLVLIPRIGIIGAAISDLSAYLILATVITVWAQKRFSFSFNFKYLIKVGAATSVMAICIKFLPVNGIQGIIFAAVVGTIAYITVLLALRAFSKQDKRLVKNTFGGLVPWLH